MSDTQDRFMDALRDAAATRGLDARVNAQYANTGNVLIHESRTDFGAPIMRIAYSFQQHYATLLVITLDSDRRSFPHADFDGDGLGEALAYIADALDGLGHTGT